MCWCAVSHWVRAKEPFHNKGGWEWAHDGEIWSYQISHHSSCHSGRAREHPLKAQLKHQLIDNALWGWGTVPQDATYTLSQWVICAVGFPIGRPYTVETRVFPARKLFLSLQLWLPQVNSFDFQKEECFYQGTQKESCWNISYSCNLGTLARRQHAKRGVTVLAGVTDPDHCCYTMKARRNVWYPSGLVGHLLVLLLSNVDGL